MSTTSAFNFVGFWPLIVINLALMYFLDFSCLTVVSARPTLALVLPQSLLDQCIFQVNWNKPVILRNETTNESVWRLFQNSFRNMSVVFTKLDWKLEVLEKSSVQCSLARVCSVILFLWKACRESSCQIIVFPDRQFFSPKRSLLDRQFPSWMFKYRQKKKSAVLKCKDHSLPLSRIC